MEKFWKKVHKTNTCWLWTGPKNKKGYGVGTMVDGRQPRAHRQSWEIHNGPIPNGLHVLHRCDVRNCINPAHLWLGTNADNIKDRDNKDRRNVNGESIGTHKLTEKQVVHIKKRYAAGKCTQKMLARRFDVTIGAIGMIVTNKNWKHVQI